MKTSIITCPCNEEKMVYGLMTNSSSNKQETEVIVVDRGSAYNTEYWMELFVHYCSSNCLRLNEVYERNFAMAYGANTSGSVVLFSDSSISGIGKKCFPQLFQTSCNVGKHDNFGAFAQTLLNYNIISVSEKGTVFNADFVNIANAIKVFCMDVENYINRYSWLSRYNSGEKEVKYIVLNDLMHPVKKPPITSLRVIEKFLVEEQEIKFSLLSNLDLMTKRMKDKKQNPETCSWSDIKNIRYQLTGRLNSIKETVHEMSLFS